MGRYVQGSDRQQVTLLPECLDDYIAEDNPVRVVEPFVSELPIEPARPLFRFAVLVTKMRAHYTKTGSNRR